MYSLSMIDNWELCLKGEKTCLVPYRKHHVGKYHAWMQDEYLLENTCSERLTLEEEYQMQESWKDDPKKCTFIILANNTGQDTAGVETHEQEIKRMAGDVNMFWNDYEDPSCVEIEVMIAEASRRRHGLAEEAVTLMMKYGVQRLKVTKFRAKILETNTGSACLFEKLGFKEVKRVSVFQEVHYELCRALNANAYARLSQEHVHIKPYTL